MAEFVASYVAGEGDFPRRSHINLLIAGFLIEFALMVDGWSTWASAIVETWPDVIERDPDPATLEALAVLEERARSLR